MVNYIFVHKNSNVKSKIAVLDTVIATGRIQGIGRYSRNVILLNIASTKVC